MAKQMSDEARNDEQRDKRYRRADEFRGVLKIKTPTVKDEKKRAKWFGVPPTPLATAAKFRSGLPVEF
jgi:cysteinyl-tRNA synthetase